MDKYKETLLSCSSNLDALTNSNGEITKYGISIVEEDNKETTILLLRKISEITNSENFSKRIKEVANFLRKSLVEYYGYLEIKRIYNSNYITEDTRTLEELLEELNNLIGLENVKAKVNDLIIYQKVQKQLGLLSKGHFIEVSRTDLIAGYQGQTALKVKNVIEKAKGGVLFIDEAYSITENEQSDSYGRECLTELTKALEDYRDDLVVIVAGYSEPMKNFFSSNPGLKSRFNTFIEFEDYNDEELLEILISMCKSNDYDLSEKVKRKLKDFFKIELQNKKENFSNGRMVRNIYEDLIMNHARRIINTEDITREKLSLITESDFNL
jgi:stage V sporulation protein K